MKRACKGTTNIWNVQEKMKKNIKGTKLGQRKMFGEIEEKRHFWCKNKQNKNKNKKFSRNICRYENKVVLLSRVMNFNIERIQKGEDTKTKYGKTRRVNCCAAASFWV